MLAAWQNSSVGDRQNFQTIVSNLLKSMYISNIYITFVEFLPVLYILIKVRILLAKSIQS